MTSPLRFGNVSLGYGGRAVLQGLTFTIPQGTFTAVSGASGSGKSTLLRAAAGLLTPIDGNLERPKSPVGWVPQEAAVGGLHPLSAVEVVRGSGRTSQRDADSVIAELDLDGLGPRRFDQLSGGQRQRVLVARALAAHTDHGAELLVFDEPTSALDQGSAALVRDAVHRRVALGATVLYATHQPGDLDGGVDLELQVANESAAAVES